MLLFSLCHIFFFASTRSNEYGSTWKKVVWKNFLGTLFLTKFWTSEQMCMGKILFHINEIWTWFLSHAIASFLKVSSKSEKKGQNRAALIYIFFLAKNLTSENFHARIIMRTHFKTSFSTSSKNQISTLIIWRKSIYLRGWVYNVYIYI